MASVMQSDGSNHANARRQALVRGAWTLSWRNTFSSTRSITDSSAPKRRHIAGPEKTVRFAKVLCSSIHEPKEPLDEELCKEIWFQSGDFSAFEKDRVLTALQYNTAKRSNPSHFNENLHTIRGIEHVCDTRLRKRQAAAKQELNQALEKEQQNQRESGTYPDFARFREVTMKHTKGARDRAISLGQDDAKFVKPKAVLLAMQALTRQASIKLNKWKR